MPDMTREARDARHDWWASRPVGGDPVGHYPSCMCGSCGHLAGTTTAATCTCRWCTARRTVTGDAT